MYVEVAGITPVSSNTPSPFGSRYASTVAAISSCVSTSRPTARSGT
jgi:hypothetical protein